MNTYRVTDEVTSATYEVETPAAAVAQFLDVGYDTGDLAEDAKFEGNVWDKDGSAVASWSARANGSGGVKNHSVSIY